VNALRVKMLPWVYVAFLSETATHGGLELQTPPQAMVMALALPSLSYVPMTHTGVGYINVFAPNDFFIDALSSYDI
jgi:hypothetical protein